MSGLLLNLGSGQRPFQKPWLNVDVQPKWNPDVLTDIHSMPMFEDNSAEMIVLWHVLEHFGCGDADGIIKECHRILQPGGKLIIACPNLEALALNFLKNRGHQIQGVPDWPPIDEWLFVINLYGAYMESEADRHKWGYTQKGLLEYVGRLGTWTSVREWNKVQPEGTDICWDWYFATVEATK